MLALYRSSVKYLENEMKMLGPTHANVAQSQAARVKHFISSLASIACDINDASEVQSELQIDTASFKADHRKEMSEAISTRMNCGDAAAGPTSPGYKGQLMNTLPE